MNNVIYCWIFNVRFFAITKYRLIIFNEYVAFMFDHLTCDSVRSCSDGSTPRIPLQLEIGKSSYKLERTTCLFGKILILSPFTSEGHSFLYRNQFCNSFDLNLSIIHWIDKKKPFSKWIENVYKNTSAKWMYCAESRWIDANTLLVCQ